MSIIVKIAICDDNISITSYIENLIDRFKSSNTIETEVFYSGEELVKDITKNESRYDIIYLDIEMKELDGIETAKKIREVDKNVKIIYITSHTDFSMTAYEVRAFRFMQKPIKDEIFERYFLDAIKEIDKGDNFLRHKFNKVEYSVAIKDIIYFEVCSRKTYIKTVNGSERCSMKVVTDKKKKT